MLRHCLQLAMLILLLGQPLQAADTIETWGRHDGNLELYSQLEGVGEAGADQAVGGAMLMGFGVARGLSAYLATAMSADGYLAGARTELNVGAFGTPLDTDHVDLDLLLEMRVADDGNRQLTLIPALELNLDRAPDLAAYGVYLRAAAEVAGSDAGKNAAPARHVDLGLTLGIYWTVSPRQQLLLEVDATVHDEPEAGEPDFERGALALGYNVLVNDKLELITEARYDLPQRGAGGGAPGFMVGLIATVPGIAD